MNNLLSPLQSHDRKLVEQILTTLGMADTPAAQPSRKRSRPTGVSIRQLRSELSDSMTSATVLSNGQTVGDFLVEQWKKQHRTKTPTPSDEND
jgi:hypothetical protein